MSVWTHVTGVIEVDTLARSSAEAVYLAQTVVNHLPKINGSEGPANYYLNLVGGCNMSSTLDEFGQPSNLCNDGYFAMFDTQTRVLITVDGHLRDREFRQALFETTKALARLSARLWVLSCTVAVNGDYQGSYVFNNPEWILEREQTDWARNLLWTFEKYNNKHFISKAGWESRVYNEPRVVFSNE